jgi:hypothetical protein
MSNRSLRWLAGMGIMVLAASVAVAEAHDRAVRRYWSGVLNDSTVAAPLGGPWEIRGEWSLKVDGDAGRADFSAALTMLRSDLGVTENGGDLDDPAARNAHTHHITLVGGSVTPIANGLRVSGPATITGNGNFPPPFGGSSTLQIDVTGGNSVAYSNVKLTFGGDATNHFGTAPVHGAVRSYREYK